MRLLVVAVGTKQPAWADTAVADFAKRFPPEFACEVKPVKAEPRTTGKDAAAMMAAEAQRIREAIPKGYRLIALDERGQRVSTRELAGHWRRWAMGGEHLAFVIGGPDGLDPALKAEAAETLRLSDLTLPHAMARLLLVEALYRAWSLASNHPYHRE